MQIQYTVGFVAGSFFTLQMISPYCAGKFKARREMPDQEYVTFMRSHFYFKLGDESGIGHVMW
jgi:hypothetical protein